MYSKIELQNIYQKVDIQKFFKHYNAKIDTKFGNEFRLQCVLPGHRDSSPSASFNVKKGLYNCFVCGGRNLFSLVKELENLRTFDDAVEFVKSMVGYEGNESHIDVLLNEMNELQNDDVEVDEQCKKTIIDFSKYPEFEDAEKHFIKVKKRVSRSMIHMWNLRYAVSGYYKDRLIIPIMMSNEVLSFAARDMSGKANKWLKLLRQAKKDKLTVTELADLKVKYECKKILYPSVLDENEENFKNIMHGTSIKTLLFNFDNAKKNSDYVILVEGVFDCMRLFTWGFNSVALCGTKLSDKNKSKILANFDKVYLALDNDTKNDKNAGQNAAQTIMKDLSKNIDVYNIVLPPNKDPDECSFEEFKQYFDEVTNDVDLLLR
jgi:DNA primase